MREWGLFNSDSASHTAADAVEADFWSEHEARLVMANQYPDDDDMYPHVIEEEEEEEEEE